MTWAKEEGADFIIDETFGTLGEAKLALEAIKKHAPGLPAVIMFAGGKWSGPGVEQDCTHDGVPRVDACMELLKLDADVVGINCTCGPKVTEVVMKRLRERAGSNAPLAAIPGPYRTTMDHPFFFNLTNPNTGERFANERFSVDSQANKPSSTTWICS